MDVRCSRCGTEYEFDDALVSERGTTVKCTNCGHQFKVHPSESGGAPERWVVRTISGRELVYTSLRELQRGIAQRQVGPDDLLSRGNQPPRPLGSIAELEPFFQGRAGATLRAAHRASTLVGVAPPAAGSYAGPNPAGPPFNVPPIPDPDAPTRVALTPVTGTPTDASGMIRANHSQVDVLGATQPEVEADPPTVPRNPQPTPLPDGHVMASMQAAAPQGVMIHSAQPDVEFSPTPASYRAALEEIPDSRYMPGPHSRKMRSRWIAGIVIVGIFALFAVTVGRRYLEKYKQAPQATAAANARVAAFLSEADKKLETADYEGAREQLDKASALAEKDPTVLAAIARLEAMRADTLWLKLRLLDPGDKQLVQATHRQLGGRVGKAKEALERAVQVAPEDPRIVRAKVDVLRLAGDLKEARALVGPLTASPSADNSYVLAALDLAEQSPVWSSIIDRLRNASGSERGLGRARAALVYALVRAGQPGDARSELDKVASASEGHPLLDDLRAFVERHSAVADAGADAPAEVATVDPASLPVLDTRPSNDTGESATAAGTPGDFRWQLQQAAAATKSGNLERAEQLYNAVLAKEPNNTEARAGLAEVAKKKKDPEAAKRMYEQVLKDNPSYLPAQVSVADAKWDSGDRKGAIAMYRRILEQAGPGSSYGQRAAARIAEGEGSPSSPPPSTGSPSGGTGGTSGTPPPAPKPPEEKPKEDQPHIDTTDLPGVKK